MANSLEQIPAYDKCYCIDSFDNTNFYYITFAHFYVLRLCLMFAHVDTGNHKVLRQAVVRTLSHTDCEARWWMLTTNMMCTSTEDGMGACSGDSGGPLVCEQGDKWLQYGITSWGNRKNCVDPHTPGVYANVVSLLPWIQQKTGSQYLHIYCVSLDANDWRPHWPRGKFWPWPH